MFLLRFRNVLYILIIFFFTTCQKEVKKENPEVKLVLQITIDGLRADLIEKYQDRFVAGGFNYLLRKGVTYTNAHYQHANTETIVGHTTLATGTSPSQHGMVGNVWYDRASGEIGYNIEDPNAPLIPSREVVKKGAQIDPAQKASRTKGRSPIAILTNTISDEIYKSSNGKAKVYGVSGKDRSAVAMAGHMGKAFWYSNDNGDFISSAYYYSSYPKWVNEWNAKNSAEGLANKSWELLNPLSTYMFAENDDRPYEVDIKGYGRVFPHEFGKVDDPLLATRVLISPKGDSLILNFAKALMREEQLGEDNITDYLSISFSSVDAVNHFFGPSSLENEDVVLQLDRTLSDLFSFISENIGLQNTLIVLSADHGMAEMPEYMNELGYDVGRIYSHDIVERVNNIGKKLYDIDGISKSFFRPSLYLETEKIIDAGLILNDVEIEIAAELTKTKGIALAVSGNGLHYEDESILIQKIINNYHKSRSGDIYVVQEPYWFLFDKGLIGVMHGSPWNYDTHVPIIFSGSDIKTGRYNHSVRPIDVAPTIAAYLGISPPASSTGMVLKEIFE